MSYSRFTKRLASSFALSVAVFAIACNGPTYVTLDGAALDSPPPRSGTLVLLSAPSLAIRPGELATIAVRCLGPGGAPEANVEVTFAIEGAALDSTLSALSARTDSDGRASGGIVAGTSATSFRVRVVSASAVAPVYVDVGVGTSFGTLVVSAPYSGARVVTRRLIDVVPRALCADLVLSPPEVPARVLPDGSDELSIAGLPTTVRYAILARAVSDLGLTASGCVDDVALATDATVRIGVPFVDAPLAIDGAYDAAITMDAAVATDSAFGLVATTLSTTAAARGGDGRTLLDAVQHELTERVSVTAGVAFAEARLTDSLDLALDERLTADASAPTALTVRWVDAASVAMAQMALDATVVVTTPGASIITTDRVTVEDAADGTLSFAPSSFAPDMGVARSLVVIADGTRDSVRVESVVLDAPLGAMLLAWLDGVARSDGLDGTPALLAPACATLRSFTAELPSALACDASCMEAACTTVITQQIAELGSAASVLDATIGMLSISGELSAADRDGDVRVDSLNGPVAGAYRNADGPTLGPVTGSIVVTRATPAP